MTTGKLTTLVILAIPLLAPTGARAQRSTFDFEAARVDQTGTYSPDAAAVVSSGVARLRPVDSPPWHSPDWPYRLAVTLTNPGAAALVDHPVRIDLSTAPDLLFDEARLDGADLLPVQVSNGAALSTRWVESLDFISRRGALWVRLATLPPGDTALYLYFGNASWSDGGSPEAFFTRVGGWVTACVVSPLAAQATLTVESFVDGNVVSLEGGTASLALDARAVGTFDAADLEPGTFLRGLGPFYGTFGGADADALVPVGLAASRFVIPSVRDENRFDVVAPWGDALVSIFDNDVLVTTATVAQGTPATVIADVADGHVARVESDRPVLVHHHAYSTLNTTDYDAHALVPAALDLLGASTGTARLVAEADNTQVTVFYSTGIRESFVLGRTDVRVLQGSGTQGSGAAARVVASAPVMAITTGDGDGGEAVSFLPVGELGRRYLLPLGAQYLQVATLGPATRCEILDGAGQSVTVQTSGTYGASYPGVLLFTAIAAGHELRCDGPAWAIFEDPATDTERNLWPIGLHRPRVEQEPTASLAAVQPRFESDRGSVTTPTFEAPWAVAQWTAFLETAVVPAGTWLRYQLSDDGGLSFRYFDGDGWAAATSLDHANPWWEIHLNIGDFPVGANRLTVKAILGSTDGSGSPALDALDLYYRQEETATSFAFDPVPSPQWAGRPFPVTLRAVDSLGRPIQRFAGSAFLQTLAGLTSPAQTPPFVDGAVTLDVAVAEVGPSVQLYAYAGVVSGQSDPFEVRAAAGARIELASGDQQFGLAGTRLPEPLAVRVLDGEGDPAAAIAVTFVVTSGDGTLLGGATAAQTLDVLTDAQGIARAAWELGPDPGANRAEARLPGAEGSPVVFTARGDRDPTQPGSKGGGCSCRSEGSRGGQGLLLLFVVLAWLGYRRRRAS